MVEWKTALPAASQRHCNSRAAVLEDGSWYQWCTSDSQRWLLQQFQGLPSIARLGGWQEARLRWRTLPMAAEHEHWKT